MSIEIKQNGKKTLMPIWSTEIGLVDFNKNFKGKNVDEALKELKEDKTNILNTIGQVDITKDGDIASQLKDCTKNIGQLSNPNLLINGDFQVWQRGTQFDCTNNNVYTADRFMVAGEQGVNLIAQKSPEGFLKLVFVSNTPNTSNIRTYFDYQDYLKMFKGKVLTFSCEYMSEYLDNWLDDIKIFGLGTQYNIIKLQKISLGNKWFRKIVTFEITNLKEDENFQIQWFRGFDKDLFGYHLFRNFKLELGTVATPFVPRSYGEELALCQRYYFRNRWLSTRISGMGSNIITTTSFYYPTTMRITPTVRPLIEQPIDAIRTMDYSVNIVKPSVEQIKPRQSGIINEEMIDFQFDSNLEVKDYSLEIKDYSYEFDSEIY